MIDFTVTDAPELLPQDTVPETADVEYPCKNCGREAGPYGGRGRKPTVCAECKPKKGNSPAKVTGTNARLAEQATAVLAQLNMFLTIGLSAVKMFGTAGAIAGYDDTFREQAYAALVTDPELCKYLLRGGVKSAKVALGLAYCGMGVAVAPTAVMEFKELQAARKAAGEVSD